MKHFFLNDKVLQRNLSKDSKSKDLLSLGLVVFFPLTKSDIRKTEFW